MATSNLPSSNAWIIKNEEPASIDASFKDGYIDMLAERRTPSAPYFNDLKWILKSVQTPQYKYKHQRDYEQLNRDVLSSDRVRVAVEEISAETKCDAEDVQKEARAIIQEMSHRFNMRSVRTLGYALMKVFKTILDHIYINLQGLQQLSELVTEYPVLLVPSHRSYFDFLLLSLICFNYDLPLPAIVAAQDFMGMAVIGAMLRNSGAFYIRRVFRSDKLYWAVFTEYVQTQLCNGDHPIEFFVEGTRSRTQKAYKPKLGMLAASLEAYFKGMVPDVMIVPVSISYDRVLEENLFAQELLGIPKPKESTSKLLKAVSILKEQYGTIHVTIGAPISVRTMSVGKVHRPIHSLQPRFRVSLTTEEDALVEAVGYAIVWKQQRFMVLSVWSLVATVLLQNVGGITLSDLTATVLWLKRHANNVGAYIEWPGGRSDQDVVKSCLLRRSSYVRIADDHVTLVQVDHGNRLKLSCLRSDLLSDAATHMVLVIYRNQLVHFFVPYCILSMIITKQLQNKVLLTKDDALHLFQFAVNLLSNEFVLDPMNYNQLFEDASKVLTHTGDVVVLENGDIPLAESVTRFTRFLSKVLLPFPVSYWLLGQYIMRTTINLGTNKERCIRPKELIRRVQQFILNLIDVRDITDYELLNLDTLSNGVQALKQLGGIYYEVRNGERYLAARAEVIRGVMANIELMADVPKISEERLTEQSLKACFQAHL